MNARLSDHGWIPQRPWSEDDFLAGTYCATVNLIESVRDDVARRGRPVGRREVPVLACIAIVAVVAAQWTEPGATIDLLALIGAGAVLVAPAVFGWVPGETFVAAVAVPVCLAVGHEGHLEVSLFLVVTACLYAAWYLGSVLRAALIVVACSVGILGAALASDGGFSWLPWVAAVVLMFVVGRTLWRQDVLVRDLEAARSALADQAVADERRRIARELHDVAGHTLAAVMLHVTGARHVLRRDPDEAERALLDAEAVGRASMDQIRATVETLRTSERGVDPPPPEADRLVDLIEEYRRTGLTIDASIDPDVADIGGAVGLATHRIAREALANVARHASTNRVEFVAVFDGGVVHLEISDHGRTVGPSGSDAVRQGGFGLVGMGERARSLGGCVSAGPSADGWRVDALLPVVGGERSRSGGA